MTAPAAEGKRIDLLRFIDYCANTAARGRTDQLLLSQGRGCGVSAQAAAARLRARNRNQRDGGGQQLRAARRTGSAMRQIASVKKWVDHASVMGAPHIRIFAGAAQGISKDGSQETLHQRDRGMRRLCRPKGVFLGLENHGGIVAEPEDLAGHRSRHQEPMGGHQSGHGQFPQRRPVSGPGVVRAVRDQRAGEVGIAPARTKKAETADLPRLIQMLRDVNYQGYVALEYKAAEDPWNAVPELLKQLKGLCA